VLLRTRLSFGGVPRRPRPQSPQERQFRLPPKNLC